MDKLIFVTDKYPFSNGETFIENEITYLSQNFDEVYIYASSASKSDIRREVPENVFCFAATPSNITYLNYFFNLFKPDVLNEINKNTLDKDFLKKVFSVCYFKSVVSASLKPIGEFLKQCNITPSDRIIVYSYWLSTPGMIAANIHKHLFKTGFKAKLVARCHRYDLYENFAYLSYLPFMEYMLKAFDKIYPCSKQGSDYLIKRFPQFKHKIESKYLGVADKFTGKFPVKDDKEFKIVSCSNVIPVKRVERIIEALSVIKDRKIIWTHFGAGSEFETIIEKAKNELPENINVNFTGRISNSKIYDYYVNNNVNLFINVSYSEGLPVSIMEATSFGIPVIATDVGGTGEIVKNGKNGFLIKSEFNTRDLTELIYRFINMNCTEYNELCNNSRDIFFNNFMASHNFSEFCKELINN